MKIRKRYVLLIYVLIFSFSFLLQENTNIQKINDSNDSFNIIPAPPNINSAVDSWYLTWEGTYSELGIGMAIDSSDNIYIGGETWDSDAQTHLLTLVKFNNSGTELWNRSWGDYRFSNPWGGVAVDSSDNVYFAGRIDTIDNYTTGFALLKYNSSGVLQWNHTWGGGPAPEGPRVVKVDTLDNIYVMGTKWIDEIDIVLLKYNSSGILQWNVTWGGDKYDGGGCMAIDSSNNIFIGGCTNSFGTGDYESVLIKYNISGVQQWNLTGSEASYGAIAIDSLDNMYTVGSKDSDIFTAKYDNLGVQQWNKTWGGSENEIAIEIALDSSNNVYIAGVTNDTEDGDRDMVFVSYNSLGVLQWNMTWGGSGYDWSEAITLDSSDNLYIMGTTSSFGDGFKMILIKNPHLGLIYVTSPVTSSSWEVGSTHTITWGSIGNISNVKIDLFRAGVFEMEITASTPNDGSYSWILPPGLTNSTQYQLKISNADVSLTYDYSEYFEIVDLRSITVVVPDVSSKWIIGNTYEINWTSTGTIVNVKIELYASGYLIMGIAASTPNDGSFSWKIPITLVNYTQYVIRINDVLDPSMYDDSDTFTITSPSDGGVIPGYGILILLGFLLGLSIPLTRRKWRKRIITKT